MGHGEDISVVSIIVTVFAIGISLLLYYWPFPTKPFLDGTRKTVTVVDIVKVSDDVKRLRCSIGDRDNVSPLGLPVGKHVMVFAPNPCVDGTWNGAADPDKREKEIMRPYVPIDCNDKLGYFDLLVKVYRPGKVVMPDGSEVEWTDGGKMSRHLESLKIGDPLEIKGPNGMYEYLGRSFFKLPGKTQEARFVAMMAGGSGITPVLQIVTAMLRDKRDMTQISLIYANKTEDDILARDILDDAEARSGGRFTVTYTLDKPPKSWKGRTGFIDHVMIRQCLPAAKLRPLVLMCGPPEMIENTCKKGLEATGHNRGMWVTL